MNIWRHRVTDWRHILFLPVEIVTKLKVVTFQSVNPKHLTHKFLLTVCLTKL